MKNLIYKILFIVFFISNVTFSADELYRSKTSGNWNNPSTWEFSVDGTNWFAATSTFPDISSGETQIRNGHNVTVPASTQLSINQFAIRTGGTVTINAGASLTITDQSSSDLFMESGSTMTGNGGIVKTYGPNVQMILRTGCIFNSPLKIDTLISTIVNDDGDLTAVLKGPVEIDTGSTLAVQGGGFRIRFDSTLRNLGNIIGSGSSVDFYGHSMVNYGNISVTNFNYYDSSVVVSDSINKAGKFTSQNINIEPSGRVRHNGNSWTIGPSALTMNIISGGKLDVSNTNFILDGTAGTIQFNLDANSSVVYTGSTYPFQTKGSVNLNLRTGSIFNAGLRVLSGTTVCYSDVSPLIGEIFSPVTINAAAVMSVNPGGYGTRAYNTVINNGEISGSGSYFFMRGNSFANNGMVSTTHFYFDTTTSLSGTGTWASANIHIRSSGKVNIANNLSIGASSAVNINIDGGGVLNPNTRTLTLNGTSGTVNLAVFNLGTISNSGIFQTQGTVNFELKTGCVFGAPFKVNSGTCNVYNSNSPIIAVFNNTITIDAGSNLNVGAGGFGINSKSAVINNGTISGSASNFYLNGNSIANNGTINVTNFYFDDTTSISGNGSWVSQNITARNSSMITLSNNLTFGPSVSTVTLQPSCSINPNDFILTLIGNPGLTFTMQSGSGLKNSGIVKTQQAVNLDLQTGCSFDTPLNVNTGTANAYSSVSPLTATFYNTITIETNSILNVRDGGFGLDSKNTLTNNGTISGPGSHFFMNGNSIVNNGTINVTNFYFDDTTSISGNGSWVSQNIVVRNLSLVTLSNNLTFGPSVSTISLQPSCTINPNGFVFTLIGNPGLTFTMQNGSVVKNPGTFKTQQSVNLDLQTGCNFNIPLHVNTGLTNAYSTLSPITAIINGTILTDSGATLNVANGGYILVANENVTNNGIISGSSSSFIFWSQNFINNGIVSVTNFYFKGIPFSPTYSHTLQGTGIFSGGNCVIEDGAFVVMNDNHQFSYLTINTGGTFDITSKTVKLSGAGVPIAVSGFLLTPGSTIEYNGIAPQTLISSNIAYENLIINDSAGVTCSDNFSIPGTLQIIKGDLDLNGKIINLLTNGILTETPGNTVKGNSGYLVVTRNLNAPNNLNVAGLGAIITTSSNLGLTEIKRGHSVQMLPSGAQAIKRYYAIKPFNNLELNATLVFKYDESEFNGNNETNLALFKSTNAGASYVADGGTANTVLNQITKTAINNFARYTAGSNSGTVNVICLQEAFYNLTTLKLNMKDTITVQLRNNVTPYNVIDSARSTLDSVTFTSSLSFGTAATDTYYVAVKHRNTLETWSKTPQIYTVGGVLNYNFSDLQTKAFGNNEVLTGTKWTFYSGDVNQNGFIDLADVIETNNAASSFTTGYVNTDINGNRIVDLTDVLFAYNNSSNFVSVKRP